MSYTRNSRFYGSYPNAAALPAPPLEAGSTAYVADTAGLPGGAAGVGGHVHVAAGVWSVHDLDTPETPNSSSPTSTASVTLSGLLNRNIAVTVKLDSGANAIEIGPNGLRVTACSVGALATTIAGSGAVRALVLDSSNCVRAVTLDTLTLRDCNDVVIATFKVIPV